MRRLFAKGMRLVILYLDVIILWIGLRLIIGTWIWNWKVYVFYVIMCAASGLSSAAYANKVMHKALDEGREAKADSYR